MVDLLADLNLTLPQVRRVCLLTGVALQVRNHIVDYKGLLKHSSSKNFFLYCKLDFESF